MLAIMDDTLLAPYTNRQASVRRLAAVTLLCIATIAALFVVLEGSDGSERIAYKLMITVPVVFCFCYIITRFHYPPSATGVAITPSVPVKQGGRKTETGSSEMKKTNVVAHTNASEHYFENIGLFNGVRPHRNV